ncbi:MAG: CbbQ/NirQ/NorQ/GpvN family protein [Dehalococcoidales bacterium]|nr:CbbQ/NirQ/NorQ/GpvN family protein [Dehalococcoidales bacterium]
MSTEKKISTFKEHRIEEYYIKEEPFYLPQADEVQIFEAAYKQKIPVLLKGPTGCGKTRFVEYMAYKLGNGAGIPLVTVACHDDLTASDLVGRYLLEGDSTKWIDGPLTRAVKSGAICYLDEIVEARKDTTVLIHPLADHRRILPIEKRGEIIEADDSFMLVISYNPGYQSTLKDLKHSTRQRFAAIEFTHPRRELEKEIIQHEGRTSSEIAGELANLGEKVRNLKDYGLEEGVSTRLLIYAAKLIEAGLSRRRAAEVVISSITDDLEVQQSVREIAYAVFK